MGTINPRVDIAFKKIFGVEENKDLLISLINSVVSEEDKVAEITLLNPYNLKDCRQDRVSILDVKAKGENGKRYNIEIQINDEGDYDKRALYYWAKLYTEQLKSGEGYSSLSKAIGIHILNFTSILGIDKYHNVFHIREKETGLPYFENLELHTIELKKFSKDSQTELTDIIALVKNGLDRWVTFLTRHDLLHKEHLPLELDDPAIKKALHVLDVMNFAPDEREAYEGHLKWLMMETSTLKKSHEKGREEGLQQGRKEGRREGRKEGLQQGREEGREEGLQQGREEGMTIGVGKGKELGAKQKAIELATKLVLKKFSLDEIVQLTDLTDHDVYMLQQSMLDLLVPSQTDKEEK